MPKKKNSKKKAKSSKKTQPADAPKLTKAQVEAAERRAKLKSALLKKGVGKKPRAMSEIITRLEALKSGNFGNPSAARLRNVLGELVEEGAVIREGERRTTTYRLP